MKKQVKNETAGKTAQLFNEGTDYSQPSIDRPFRWQLEDGNIIYLNLEQRQFLARDYYNEAKREEREKRCIIPSLRTGMTKRCRGICSECEYFRSGKDTYGTVSLDSLYDKYEWEPTVQEESVLDELIKEERLNAMYEAIDSLEDEIDKRIINLFLENFTERKIAEVIGMSQKGVNKRKTKIIEVLREKLKDYR